MSQMAACPTGFRISTIPSEQVLLSYGEFFQQALLGMMIQLTSSHTRSLASTL